MNGRSGLSSTAKFAQATLCALLLIPHPAGQCVSVPLVAPGSSWRYLDDGADPGPKWKDPGYDDSAWLTGPTQLGYGDGDEAWTVNYGGEPENKRITTWFRRTFHLADADRVSSLQLGLLRDDGAVVYLNGTEIRRSNMPPGTVTSATLAIAPVSGGDESVFHFYPVPDGLLLDGPNVLAVEVHQYSPSSSDISFNLGLVASGDGSVVTRGPYLQLGTSSTMVVRWRSDGPHAGRVRYGPSADSLTGVVDEVASRIEHSVTLAGLSPDTQYYYMVGSTSTTLASNAGATSFATLPPPGQNKATRIWQLSDYGRGIADQRLVYNGFRRTTAERPPDLWITTGDNSQYVGADSDYQLYLFEFYPEMLASLPVFTAFGNHDSYSADSATQTGPYYDNFTLPRNGEAGGIASGTEAYYSFDYGAIHFVCLDATEGDLTTTGPMMTWLQADLAANDSDWLIAYWHHPPYTKGTHDSDNLDDGDGRMTHIRERFLPVLEANGVDLVLNGHSHVYERSHLLDGHYGFSTSFNAAMQIDPGDGRTDGTGAYAKPSRGPAANQGAVYVVAAIGGWLGNGPLNHPAMFVSESTLGFVLIDVDGNRLDAQAIRPDGSLIDHFTIVKDTMTTPAVAAMDRLDPSPTSTSVVRYRVLFNHSVSGVDAGDFVTSATGISGAAVAGTSGSGTSWIVSVGTGTGDGALELCLVDDDTIVNGVTAPLGGAGANNGSWSATKSYHIDKTPPSVTFSLLDPDPTNHDSVSYGASFSEPVAPSFGISRVNVVGSLAAGASLAVSGTDPNYTLTVTMAEPNANGTIGIELGGGITDTAGNALSPISSPLYTIDQATPTRCRLFAVE